MAIALWHSHKLFSALGRAAHEVLEYAADPQRVSPELRPHGAGSRLQSDVAGAVEVRARDDGGDGGWDKGTAVGAEGVDPCNNSDDACTVAASDPGTRVAPWNH
ncbi:hypothetical protein GPECTOR_46g218 [Gonium pectorale]|uniref:Uncharacterized protein n=1 Tax=Gonium pectorale TaxID=33097 RepID=A0A150G8G6_GONPE|nr:hypothetical protein GPECTOR_46g218 [Gonium pectorale]|eukprot:KXZ46149.1 hypothetical protein GPECTOR_46g218 [Gonium pectorale]